MSPHPLKDSMGAYLQVHPILSNLSQNIIAAIIFWLAFSVLPDNRRRSKLRPKMEIGLYQVYTSLFSLFDSVMRFNSWSPSGFQERIRGNKLKAEDIALGLQNKCLNSTFLYDPSVKMYLMPIGEGLFETQKTVDKLVDRAFAFSNQLTPDEILSLEKIRAKLESYDLEHFTRNALIKWGDSQGHPVNPSLSYMQENLTELYQLFIHLQNIVFSNKFEDRNILLNHVQITYEQGKYNQCLRLIRRGQSDYPADKNLLDFYRFSCEYQSGKRKKSLKILEGLFVSKAHLVSNRTFLEEIRNDDQINQLINKHYSLDEINELDAVIESEARVQKEFLDQAVQLRNYYASKVAAISGAGSK